VNPRGAAQSDRAAAADDAVEATDDRRPKPLRRRGDVLAALRDSPPPTGVVEIMQRLRVHPNIPSGRGQQTRLRHRPFLEGVQSLGPVVGQAHLRLRQDSPAAEGAWVAVDRLTPFAELGLCLAHRSPAGEP
jgi:hypothetical protein